MSIQKTLSVCRREKPHIWFKEAIAPDGPYRRIVFAGGYFGLGGSAPAQDIGAALKKLGAYSDRAQQVLAGARS